MKRMSSYDLQNIKTRISKETGVHFAYTGGRTVRSALLLAAVLILTLGATAVFAVKQFRISMNVLEPPAAASDVAGSYGEQAKDAEGNVNSFKISAPFGYSDNPYTVSEYSHSGVDIVAPRGTPVFAAAAGTVKLAEWSAGYGNTVIIDHEDGYSTCYGHLDDIAVSGGQKVEAGEQIGTVGATGMATGPHLHFELRIDDEPVDPSGYWE